MLDVQKFEETEVKPQINIFNIKNLFLKAYRQVEYLFREKNIQFELVSDEIQEYPLDADLISRVTVNLLNNASKFTPNNGHVSVIVEALNSDKASLMRVSVMDNGIGIPAEELDSIFNKYRHSDTSPEARTQSTGLGLTFCKLAVEAHDGEIGVYSKEGEGSTFWFTLPENPVTDKLVQESDPQEDITIQTSNWSLTDKDKQSLIPVVNELQQYEVFESSSIKEILNTINPPLSDNLSQWKQALENSIYAGNEERYKELLDMVVIY